MSHGRWLSLTLLLCLTACGGNKTDWGNKLPPALPPAVGGLPLPSEVLRTASFEDGSQVRQGMEFEPSIPPMRSAPDFSNNTFINLNPADQPELSPAWVVYSFDLTGYDEEPLVKLTWKSKPLNDTVYLALANWDAERWDFVATDPVSVTLPDLAPYISAAGKTLVAVIAVGSVQHQLRWLAIGDAPGPARPMIFGVNPRSSQPGTDLTLIPTYTGTEPVTYFWNFGGGATPDTSTDEKPTVNMGPLGDYNCTLTVSNKYGADIYLFQIHSVIPGWVTHSLGTPAKNKFVALETTWTDQSLVAGEMDNERVSLFHFDQNGDIGNNLAYTGLPANRVTDMVLVTPNINDAETDRRTCYMSVYHDDGSGPGNAYILRLDEDGSVMWYLPLGPGIPDVSRIDDNQFAASLARIDGKSVAVLGNADGSVVWAKETVEPANYICSAGGTLANEGIYLCGSKNGKPAVLRVAGDGVPAWAVELTENITITSCSHVQETALAITGTLPLGAEQKVDSFYLLMRLDTLLLAHSKFRTHPVRPLRATYQQGFVFVSAGTVLPGESRLYILDALGGLFRGLKLEGSNGMLSGDCRLTRTRPGLPGELEPPEQPAEQVIFAGSAAVRDITISTIDATFDTEWRPLLTNINADMVDATLPTEALTITPEPVATYTIDTPAGDLDGLYVRATDVF